MESIETEFGYNNEFEEDDMGKAFRDYYAVSPPFGYVGIELDEDAGTLKYNVVEPQLSEEEISLINTIKALLIDRMDVPLSVLRDEEEMEFYLRAEIQGIFNKLKRQVAKESEDKYIYYLKRDFLGYGKIDVLMNDENIEDISCNGYNTPLYVWHRDYESIPTNVIYDQRDELDRIVTRLSYRSGRQISISHPIQEGSLPEGYRVQLTLDEVSKRGHTFTIRKFRENPFSIIDLIRFGTISTRIGAYLWLLVEHGRSVMICGATASGKTTLLNGVTAFIKPEMKVITIEEVRELRLHENWIPMVPRESYQPGIEEVTLFDLLKSALRQRPDFIVVGEIRGEEAYTLFQSIATGHGGLCTIHSDSVDYALKRLQTEPMNIPEMMLPLMNVLIQIRRVKINGKVVRRADTVTETLGLGGGDSVQVENRFRWMPKDDNYRYLEPSGRGENAFTQIQRNRHIDMTELHNELENREKVLKYLLDNGVNDPVEVSKWVTQYYINPENVMNGVKFGENA